MAYPTGSIRSVPVAAAIVLFVTSPARADAQDSARMESAQGATLKQRAEANADRAYANTGETLVVDAPEYDATQQIIAARAAAEQQAYQARLAEWRAAVAEGERAKAQWEADVAACNGGNRARCAPR